MKGTRRLGHADLSRDGIAATENGRLADAKQAPDLGRDHLNVHRPGRVYGDGWPSPDRPGGSRESLRRRPALRTIYVHRVPGRCPLDVPAHAFVDRALTVHLDRHRAERAQPRLKARVARPELASSTAAGASRASAQSSSIAAAPSR